LDRAATILDQNASPGNRSEVFSAGKKGAWVGRFCRGGNTCSGGRKASRGAVA